MCSASVNSTDGSSSGRSVGTNFTWKKLALVAMATLFVAGFATALVFCTAHCATLVAFLHSHPSFSFTLVCLSLLCAVEFIGVFSLALTIIFICTRVCEQLGADNEISLTQELLNLVCMPIAVLYILNRRG